MSISKVIFNNNIIMDSTNTTAVPDKVYSGYTFMDANGEYQVGTANGGGVDYAIMAGTPGVINNFAYMFANTGTSFNGPVKLIASDYNINIVGMFSGCSKYNGSLDISAVNNTPVTRKLNCYELFNGCSNFNNTVNFAGMDITCTANMFANCRNFNSNIIANSISPSDASYMFYNCESFNQPINIELNNTNVSYISMFANCYSFNQSVNINNATQINRIFTNCRNFNQPVNISVYLNGGNISGVFSGCENLNQPINISVYGSGGNLESWFSAARNFNQPIIINTNTNTAVSLRWWFDYDNKNSLIDNHIIDFSFIAQNGDLGVGNIYTYYSGFNFNANIYAVNYISINTQGPVSLNGLFNHDRRTQLNDGGFYDPQRLRLNIGSSIISAGNMFGNMNINNIQVNLVASPSTVGQHYYNLSFMFAKCRYVNNIIFHIDENVKDNYFINLSYCFANSSKGNGFNLYENAYMSYMYAQTHLNLQEPVNILGNVLSCDYIFNGISRSYSSSFPDNSLRIETHYENTDVRHNLNLNYMLATLVCNNIPLYLNISSNTDVNAYRFMYDTTASTKINYKRFKVHLGNNVNFLGNYINTKINEYNVGLEAGDDCYISFQSIGGNWILGNNCRVGVNSILNNANVTIGENVNLSDALVGTTNITVLGNLYEGFVNSKNKIRKLQVYGNIFENVKFSGFENLCSDMPLYIDSSVRDISNMFNYCLALGSDGVETEIIYNIDPNEGPINAVKAFYNCRSLRNVIFNTMSIPNDSNCSNMFCMCRNLINIPITSIGNNCNCMYMFSSCYYLTNIPTLLIGDDCDCSNMFHSCSNLNINSTLLIGSNCNCMYMFYNCNQLYVPSMTFGNDCNLVYALPNHSNATIDNLIIGNNCNISFSITEDCLFKVAHNVIYIDNITTSGTILSSFAISTVAKNYSLTVGNNLSLIASTASFMNNVSGYNNYSITIGNDCNSSGQLFNSCRGWNAKDINIGDNSCSIFVGSNNISGNIYLGIQGGDVSNKFINCNNCGNSIAPFNIFIADNSYLSSTSMFVNTKTVAGYIYTGNNFNFNGQSLLDSTSNCLQIHVGDNSNCYGMLTTPGSSGLDIYINDNCDIKNMLAATTTNSIRMSQPLNIRFNTTPTAAECANMLYGLRYASTASSRGQKINIYAPDITPFKGTSPVKNSIVGAGITWGTGNNNAYYNINLYQI